MNLIFAIIGAFLALSSSVSFGISYSVGPAVGLMQQPTSHYYHYVYGSYLEAGTENRRIYLKAIYVERPKFNASGFSDQEFGGFGFLGTQLTPIKKYYAINTMIGGGKVSGYIKQNDDSGGSSYPARKYSLNGLALGVEASVALYKVHASIFHQSFIGLSSQEDYDSDVAWPFNFFLVKVGLYL